MLKTQKIYLPVSVKERTPNRDMWINVLTKASNLPQECWYYKKLFYKDATYQKKHYHVTYWLEEKEMIVLTQEQHDNLFLTAVEWGFRSGEKGNNLEKTMIDFKKLMTDK